MIPSPLYWRNEVSDLPAAVEAYINHRLGGPEPTREQLQRVIAYIHQWVNSPVWDQPLVADDSYLAELQGLRDRARLLASAESIGRWIEEAMDLGIDPL